MAPEMTVTGLAGAMALLREAPAKLQARVIKGAVASAAAVIRREAALRAPIFSGIVGASHPPPGTLRKAIYQARLTSECTETLEVWLVSVRKGPKAQQNKAGNLDAYYATWVEYGTIKMSARPYMRPAFEAKKGEAVEAMRAHIVNNLPAILRG